MASTNKTTNYELSQFIETDKPGWLTDYNGDMRTIDSNMKAISDVADGASGSVSSLESRMTAAEGAITTNENDIDALEARADALEAQAQSTAGTIAGIQTEQITQNAGIEAATELGYNLARPYDSASTYAVGAYVLFQNTLYKCITAVSTGEAFDPTKWLAIKATDEIAAGGYTLPIASASQLGGVKVGSNLSIDQDGVLSGSAPYILPIASANDLGGVKVGNNLSIDSNGVLSASGWVEDTNAYYVFEGASGYTSTGSRFNLYTRQIGHATQILIIFKFDTFYKAGDSGTSVPATGKIYNFPTFPYFSTDGTLINSKNTFLGYDSFGYTDDRSSQIVKHTNDVTWTCSMSRGVLYQGTHYNNVWWFSEFVIINS